MPNTFKILAQSAPSSGTDTTLYTVPSATQVISNVLWVCNRGTANATFRVAIRPDGATLANEHYIVYDATVAANDSIPVNNIPPMDANDVVTVRASTAAFSFTLGGCEIT